MIIENLETFFAAIFAGILYAVIWWGAKNLDPTKPSPSFKAKPLIATIIIGAAIGGAAVLYGAPLTQMGLETQLMASGAAIAMVEKVLSTIYNYLSTKRAERSAPS